MHLKIRLKRRTWNWKQAEKWRKFNEEIGKSEKIQRMLKNSIWVRWPAGHPLSFTTIRSRPKHRQGGPNKASLPFVIAHSFSDLSLKDVCQEAWVI